MMTVDLTGRRATVCGSSMGLGLACAIALARSGADVLINGRSSPALLSAREEIERLTGHSVRHVVGDVTTSEGRIAILGSDPEPDILVTNSAGPPPGDFERWDEGTWIDAVTKNMVAPIQLIRSAVGPMRKRSWGRIINITSSAVKEPLPLLGLSTGARSGLTGFVASIVKDVARHGITINNLLPGMFDTARLRSYLFGVAATQGMSVDMIIAKERAAIPAGRFGQPEEFGAVCAFLASNWGAYITGQNIVLDGGAHRGML